MIGGLVSCQGPVTLITAAARRASRLEAGCGGLGGVSVGSVGRRPGQWAGLDGESVVRRGGFA